MKKTRVPATNLLRTGIDTASADFQLHPRSRTCTSRCTNTLICLRLQMDALLVIALVCFFALFVVALAIARHIRIVEPQHHCTPPDSLWLGSHRPEGAAIHPISRQSIDQNLHKLVQHKEPDWRYLISGERRSISSRKSISPATRKPPESARLSLRERRERPHWTYSDQNGADLTDPYTRSPAQPASTGGSWTIYSLCRKG